MKDLQQLIKANSHRSIIVDEWESGIYLHIYTDGGSAYCSMSRESAIELVRAIQSIIDQGVNHE